jgi:hypothetical protein
MQCPLLRGAAIIYDGVVSLIILKLIDWKRSPYVRSSRLSHLLGGETGGRLPVFPLSHRSRSFRFWPDVGADHALGADHARPELAHQEIARVLVDVEAHLVATSHIAGGDRTPFWRIWQSARSDRGSA